MSELSEKCEIWIDEHEDEIIVMEADEIARKAFFAGVEAAQQSVQRTALPVKAKVVCFNGHARVVEGKDFDDACPECGAGIGEYDSRFDGE